MNFPILLADGINWHSFFFLFFALIACGMALAVLFSSNIVRMAFYLTISLGSVAGLFILAGAHFVGAMQLMIYVGGTLVLLIFGVMLTAQAQFVEMKTKGGEWILAAIVGGSMLTVLLAAATSVKSWRQPSDDHIASIQDIDVSPDTTSLGAALIGLRVDSLAQEDQQLRRGMSGYFVHFEIVSVHLLVVLLGAAYLARAKVTIGDPVQTQAVAEHPNRRRGIVISLILLLVTLGHLFYAGLCGWVTFAGLPAPLAEEYAGIEGWLWPAAGLVHGAIAFSYIAIIRWQQWGFWALCGLGFVLAAMLYAAGAGPIPAVLSLVATAIWLLILFGILKIGGQRSIWAQME